MRWKAPSNVAELVAADPDHMWEDDQFDPIKLTAMDGTRDGDRDVPLAWQFEFEPADMEGSPAEERLEALGFESDGYGWTALILGDFARRFPECAAKVRSDEELATCVITAEDSEIFERLVDTALATLEGEADV